MFPPIGPRIRVGGVLGSIVDPAALQGPGPPTVSTLGDLYRAAVRAQFITSRARIPWDQDGGYEAAGADVEAFQRGIDAVLAMVDHALSLVTDEQFAIAVDCMRVTIPETLQVCGQGVRVQFQDPPAPDAGLYYGGLSPEWWIDYDDSAHR